MSQGVNLAQYKAIADYEPGVGDFVMWMGLFRTLYGIVNAVDPESKKVSVLFESTPRMLFTMSQAELTAATRIFDINDIRQWRLRGSWYAQKLIGGSLVWYV